MVIRSFFKGRKSNDNLYRKLFRIIKITAGLELIEELKDKKYFKFYSKKRNKSKAFRYVIWIIINKIEAKLVLIDTFSTFAIWIAFFCALFCQILNIKYIPIVRGGDFFSSLQCTNISYEII